MSDFQNGRGKQINLEQCKTNRQNNPVVQDVLYSLLIFFIFFQFFQFFSVFSDFSVFLVFQFFSVFFSVCVIHSWHKRAIELSVKWSKKKLADIHVIWSETSLGTLMYVGWSVCWSVGRQVTLPTFPLEHFVCMYTSVKEQFFCQMAL